MLRFFISSRYYALSALQKLIHVTYPGRCPGLLHFAPSALGSRVLTQSLKRRAKVKATLRVESYCETFWVAAFRLRRVSVVDVYGR